MSRALLALAGALALAGCAGGTETVTVTERETTTETATETVTQTETAAAAPVGLPPAVAETHAALLEAAESGDYEALRPLLPASGFSYTFGGEVQGGPIAYWQLLERQVDERPIEIRGAAMAARLLNDRGSPLHRDDAQELQGALRAANAALDAADPAPRSLSAAA